MKRLKDLLLEQTLLRVLLGSGLVLPIVYKKKQEITGGRTNRNLSFA